MSQIYEQRQPLPLEEDANFSEAETSKAGYIVGKQMVLSAMTAMQPLSPVHAHSCSHLCSEDIFLSMKTI